MTTTSPPLTNCYAAVKRRTSHEPSRMLMKLNVGEQKVFLICIRFRSCEVRRLTRALITTYLSGHRQALVINRPTSSDRVN